MPLPAHRETSYGYQLVTGLAQFIILNLFQDLITRTELSTGRGDVNFTLHAFLNSVLLLNVITYWIYSWEKPSFKIILLSHLPKPR